MPQPSLQTERLILRPFRRNDASAVQELAGAREIADTTMNVPHPYEDGMAEQWIGTHEADYESGTSATFAIVLREGANLVGAIGLRLDRSADKAELGYWVGKPYWNLGFATEATGAVLAFGFDELRLNRIQARHFARNPASGRVMEKAGMILEGTARQAAIKWGEYEDFVWYAILREEWSRRRTVGSDR